MGKKLITIVGVLVLILVSIVLSIADPISPLISIIYPENNTVLNTNYTIINVSINENISSCILAWDEFHWNNFTTDTEIIMGLPTGWSSYSGPDVFQKDGVWYLIYGGVAPNTDGLFYGYNWTGTTWQTDNNIVMG